MSFQNSGEIIKEIDELNKEKEVNLIILNLKTNSPYQLN